MTFEAFLFQAVELMKRDAENRAPQPEAPAAFSVVRKAGALIQPSKTCAAHHHAREQYYTAELEKAEKKLKEEGLSIEVIDPKTGVVTGVTSGGISKSNINDFTNCGQLSQMPKFQPKVDVDMLAAVERNKTKMLEHRSKANQYDKYAAAFSCAPEQEVRLSIEDVHYFRLGQEARIG